MKKRTTMLKIIIIFTALAMNLNASKDLMMNAKEQELIKTVLSVDGYIDEALYNAFWKRLRVHATKEILEDLRAYVPEAQKTQLMLWTAIKQTVKDKKPYYTREVKHFLAEHKNKPGYELTYNNTVKLFEHAASGKPMKLHGQLQYVSIDMADQVLSGLNASIERFEILLADSWNPMQKERDLNQFFKVLWHLPFVKSNIVLDNGVKISQYQSAISESSVVMIGININPNGPEVSAEEVVNHCVKNAVATMGIDKPIIQKENFRNIPSASTSIVINSAGEKFFSTVQCSLYKNNILMISSFSTDPIEESLYFNGLKDNIMLK